MLMLIPIIYHVPTSLLVPSYTSLIVRRCTSPFRWERGKDGAISCLYGALIKMRLVPSIRLRCAKCERSSCTKITGTKCSQSCVGSRGERFALIGMKSLPGTAQFQYLMNMARFTDIEVERLSGLSCCIIFIWKNVSVKIQVLMQG